MKKKTIRMYLIVMALQLLLLFLGSLQVKLGQLWLGIFNIALNSICLIINYKNLNTEMDNYKKEKQVDLDSLFDRFDKLKKTNEST